MPRAFFPFTHVIYRYVDFEITNQWRVYRYVFPKVQSKHRKQKVVHQIGSMSNFTQRFANGCHVDTILDSSDAIMITCIESSSRSHPQIRQPTQFFPSNSYSVTSGLKKVRICILFGYILINILQRKKLDFVASFLCIHICTKIK